MTRRAAVGLTHTATLTERQSSKRYEGLVAARPEDVRCTIGNVQKLLHTASPGPRRNGAPSRWAARPAGNR